MSSTEGKEIKEEDVKKIDEENGKEDMKSPKTKVEDSDIGNALPKFENNGSEKRTGVGSDLPSAKRQKIHESCYRQTKNAISQLNELDYDTKYVFDPDSGLTHNPTFVCSALVSGKQFIGKGSSKKLAKHAAAEAALKSFIQFRDSPTTTFKAPSRETSVIDFTDDNVGNTDFTQSQLSEKVNESIFVQSKMERKLRKLNAEIHKKGPLVLLNEICPGLSFAVISEDPTCQNQRFVMNVTIDGTVFEGAGPNKKAAKVAVARTILSEKYNMNFSFPKSEPLEIVTEGFAFSQELADKIAELVRSSMSKLVNESKKCPKKWEALASVVMTTDHAMEDMKVICLATGSGSLSGENMSLIGAVLNDCHAEVLARRCLKDFLFTQLELHTIDKPNESVFEKVNGKFKLKPNYKFHFYSTTVPCGAARESNSSLVSEQEMHKSGTLRTKLESGSGTIVVESIKSEQNAEDIMAQRARYQVMSCSDKLTIWNVLGIQGSLLNYFIEPVHFHSVIFGQPCHLSYVVYTMFSRIEHSLEALPSPFSLHKSQIATSLTTAAKPLEQPERKTSINWTCGLNSPELLAASTGKPTVDHLSRLAKRSFFQRFSNLYNMFLKTPALSHFYDSVKKASPDYQQAKEVVLKAFVSSGLGIWKKKPKEQDAFELLF